MFRDQTSIKRRGGPVLSALLNTTKSKPYNFEPRTYNRLHLYSMAHHAELSQYNTYHYNKLDRNTLARLHSDTELVLQLAIIILHDTKPSVYGAVANTFYNDLGKDMDENVDNNDNVYSHDVDHDKHVALPDVSDSVVWLLESPDADHDSPVLW